MIKTEQIREYPAFDPDKPTTSQRFIEELDTQIAFHKEQSQDMHYIIMLGLIETRNCMARAINAPIRWVTEKDGKKFV